MIFLRWISTTKLKEVNLKVCCCCSLWSWECWVQCKYHQNYSFNIQSYHQSHKYNRSYYVYKTLKVWPGSLSSIIWITRNEMSYKYVPSLRLEGSWITTPKNPQSPSLDIIVNLIYFLVMHRTIYNIEIMYWGFFPCNSSIHNSSNLFLKLPLRKNTH